MNLAPYLKTVTSLAVSAVGWATFVIASPSGPVTASEWLMGAVAGLTALGVYVVPNKQG